MGLDVYLIPKEIEERNSARNEQEEQLYERKERGEISDEEYERLRDELPGWERYPEVESKQHGDHLFNRRYLRSSYNHGGFNNAVPELVGEENKNLYWVFEDLLSEEEYSITLTKSSIPALKEARKRALWLAEKLRSQKILLRTDSIDAVNYFEGKPKDKTADDALAWYREHAEKDDGPFSGGWWSSGEGHFFGKADDPDAGLRILACVPGVSVLKTPCVHLIYEMPQASMEDYAKSADITAEFCEEAIELIERDGEAYIHWSA